MHVTHNMLPAIRHPQHIHTSPTTCCPQYVARNTFTRHPQYVAHNTLPTTHCPPQVAQAKHELRQACMGAIIKAIDDSAQDGFYCLLKENQKRLLFPIICRMEFDTKERYKFFCCHKQRTCGIGSGPRQGRSALRTCTPHASRLDLPAKRRSAADPRSVDHAKAVKSLIRWGIHPSRQCTALMGRTCLLQWPGRIHFGLYAYDVMHHLYINTISYCLDTLLDNMTPRQKRQLDARVRSLGSFRTHEGVTSKRVSTLSTTGCLTAEMKVQVTHVTHNMLPTIRYTQHIHTSPTTCYPQYVAHNTLSTTCGLQVLHLFLWIHALGSQALLLPDAIRSDALVALTSLQTICYSVRNSRPYTEAEHRFIFSHLGKKFWRALSAIEHRKRQSRIDAAESYNIGKPPNKRRRVPYWRTAERITDESSDTESSSDSDVPDFFIRSAKIVPHSFEHFWEQVIMGGTHLFHDVSMQESHHRIVISGAGARSRTYHDRNRSALAMLHYLHDQRLFREIYIQARIDDDDGTCICHPTHFTHNTLPTILRPQHVAHNIFTHHPQHVAHNTFPRHPQHVAHNMSPTTH